MEDLNFSSVRDFCAIAELRSFQRAAEKRRISQPALSRRMQALERSLGATLLDRTSHPVCLTKAGEAFLPFALEALKEISEGAELFRSVITGLSDPITIAATHTVAVSFFPGWVTTLSLPDAPKGIVLNAFRTERCFMELAGGRADFGLCLLVGGESVPDEFESVTVGRDQLLPVCAAKPQGAAPWRLSNLSRAKIPLLCLSPGSSLGEAIDARLQSLPGSANLVRTFESPSSEVLKSMTLEGFGVSYLPKMLIADELKNGRLVLAGASSLALPIKIELFRRPNPLSESAQRVWDSANIKSTGASGRA